MFIKHTETAFKLTLVLEDFLGTRNWKALKLNSRKDERQNRSTISRLPLCGGEHLSRVTTGDSRGEVICNKMIQTCRQGYLTLSCSIKGYDHKLWVHLHLLGNVEES